MCCAKRGDGKECEEAGKKRLLIVSLVRRCVSAGLCSSSASDRYMSGNILANTCVGIWTGRSDQVSGSCFEIGGGERVVSLHPFSPVDVGAHKGSSTCHSSKLVEVVKAYFESEKWATRFEKDATEEEFLIKVSNTNVL